MMDLPRVPSDAWHRALKPLAFLAPCCPVAGQSQGLVLEGFLLGPASGSRQSIVGAPGDLSPHKSLSWDWCSIRVNF